MFSRASLTARSLLGRANLVRVAASTSAPVCRTSFGTQRLYSDVAERASVDAGNDVASSVEFNDKRTTVYWASGQSISFPNAYLRDHCPQDLHSTSMQRQFDTASIPEGIQPVRCVLSEDAVHIEWNTGDVGDYGLDFLRTIAPADQHPISNLKQVQPQPWVAGDFPLTEDGTSRVVQAPRITAQQVVSQGKEFDQALEQLLSKGFLIVEEMAATFDTTKQVCNMFGPIRRTFYADSIWDTLPKAASQVNDTAYTNLALRAHTDCTYFTSPPGLQFFNCATQSTEGGNSIFVDGLSVASKLRAENPEAFEFFSTVQLPYQAIEDGVFVKAQGPVFELDDHGNVKSFRYNNDDRAPLTSLTTSEIEAFYRHVPSLLRLLGDPELMLPIKLKVGEMIVINNQRILHGRQAFQGKRNMIGCYIDMDDLLSTARVHGLSLTSYP